jgi:hypothetical protein
MFRNNFTICSCDISYLSSIFRKSLKLLSQPWHRKWFRGDGIKEEVICLLRWLMARASSSDRRLHLSFTCFRRNCIQLSCWKDRTTRSTRSRIITINHVLSRFYLHSLEILCKNYVTWTNVIVDLSLLKLLKYFDKICCLELRYVVFMLLCVIFIFLLMWLYNSFIEFWPSKPTPSIFLCLGQESSNLVLLTSVYLF